jgi:hypothetical protein
VHDTDAVVEHLIGALGKDDRVAVDPWRACSHIAASPNLASIDPSSTEDSEYSAGAST